LTSPQTVDGAEVVDFNYHSKSDKCEKFKAGVDAAFTIEKRTFGTNGIEYKIIPQAPAFTPGSKGGFKKDSKNEARITWLSCFSSVCTLYQGSSFVNSFPELLKKANDAYTE